MRTDELVFGGNVTLADFEDVFCDAARCPTARDNVLLYRDAHHISATASRLMAPHLEKALRATLAEDRHDGR